MDNDGLICAYVLDGSGSARSIWWDEIRAWQPGRQGVLWVHLDRTGSEARRWLVEESEVDDVVTDQLLAEVSRPRMELYSGGLLLSLRGVNMRANPEDMVWVQIWAESGRVITSRRRKIEAIDDVRRDLIEEHRAGARTVGDFIVRVANRLLDRLGPAIDDLEDVVGRLEERMDVAQEHVTNQLEPVGHWTRVEALRREIAVNNPEVSIDENDVTNQQGPRALRTQLAIVRREIIALRRYVAPQREVFFRLQAEESSIFDQPDRIRLRELHDRISRFLEQLDVIRDRAAITQEEIAQRISERIDRRMSTLSVIAAIFLPLGLLVGVLGINILAVPGGLGTLTFWIVTGALGVIAVAEVWLFRRFRWF